MAVYLAKRRRMDDSSPGGRSSSTSGASEWPSTRLAVATGEATLSQDRVFLAGSHRLLTVRNLSPLGHEMPPRSLENACPSSRFSSFGGHTTLPKGWLKMPPKASDLRDGGQFTASTGWLK